MRAIPTPTIWKSFIASALLTLFIAPSYGHEIDGVSPGKLARRNIDGAGVIIFAKDEHGKTHILIGSERRGRDEGLFCSMLGRADLPKVTFAQIAAKEMKEESAGIYLPPKPSEFKDLLFSVQTDWDEHHEPIRQMCTFFIKRDWVPSQKFQEESQKFEKASKFDYSDLKTYAWIPVEDVLAAFHNSSFEEKARGNGTVKVLTTSPGDKYELREIFYKVLQNAVEDGSLRSIE